MANCSGFRTALGLLAVVGFAAAASAQQVDTGSKRSNQPGLRATATTQPVIKQAPSGSTAAVNPGHRDPKLPPLNAFGRNGADNCGAAPTIGAGTQDFDTTAATQDGSTTCGFNAILDVWWDYVPANSGVATFSTCNGTGMDTVLAVFDACGGTQLACLDDFCNFQTQLSFNVVAGNHYKLRLAGYNGISGTGTMTVTDPTVSGPCTNFDCCAHALAVGEGDFPYDATGATTDGVFSCGFNVGNDVWFDYTATITGLVNITTCDPSRNYDTVMEVLDGGCGGTSLGCSDDDVNCEIAGIFGGSTVTLGVTAGNHYLIDVGCYNSGAAGSSVLHIAPPPPPCTLSVPPGAADEGEPCGSDTDGGCNSFGFVPIACGGVVQGTAWAAGGTRDTDWYEMPAVSVRTTVTWTGQAQFPLQLFVLDGNCPPAILAAAASVNPCDIVTATADVCPGAPAHFFAGTQAFDGTPCVEGGDGNMYWVQLVSCVASPTPPPANDDCANATVVSVPSVTPFDLNGSCNDFAGSCGASASSPDVWYTFTAPTDGRLIANVCNLTDLDTVIGVLAACGGPELACNDDFCGLQSEACVAVQQGVQYWVRVSSFANGIGSGSVSIDVLGSNYAPPPGGTDENEPCGSDTNGGCNSVPPIFGAITTDGTPVYGNAWAQGGTRDTDWYSYTSALPLSVTYTGQALFPLQLFILDGNCPPAILAAVASDCTGGAVSVTAEVPAGTNNVFAGTQAFDGTPCGSGGNDYWITLVGTPLAPCLPLATPPGAVEENEACGSDTNGGCNSTPNLFQNVPCNQTIHGTSSAAAGTRDTDWYSFTAPASGTVTMTAESDFHAVYFILDVVGTDPCGAINLLAINGSSCNGGPVTVTASGLIPGNTYYFFASTGNADGSGIFDGIPCPSNYNVSFDIGTPCGNACPCDFNNDTFLNSQDFFDFLSCFFTPGCPNADYNHDTFVNSQDFFDFLSCFFAPPAGCP